MKNGNAVGLALRLMKEHGLEKWKLLLSNSKELYGQCDFNSKTIELSKVLTGKQTYGEVRDTVLHEIAHAKRGNHLHDREWKEICVAIGAVPYANVIPHSVAAKMKNGKIKAKHTAPRVAGQGKRKRATVRKVQKN